MNNPITLVEKHKIYKGHPFFEEIDQLCFSSKNLYNAGTYFVRQAFIRTSEAKENGLMETAQWMRYNDVENFFKRSKNQDYEALPRKVSQQILMQIDKEWKSFFAANKDYNKSPEKYKARPKMPNYKEKQTGRNMLVYTIQAISSRELRKGIVSLSGTTIKIQTKQQNICQARIVPKNGYYTIEIVYEKEKEAKNVDKNRIAGIDIGVNNLAAVTSNVGDVRPILINGRPLKSTNNHYNKNLAKLMSYVGGAGTSNRIRTLTQKRENKIENYLHHASKLIIEHCIQHMFGTIVIGKNKGWKNKVKLGDDNNQNFVQIPHARFIFMIQYKAEMAGIEVIITEESHTSKCSFIDMEPIKHQEKYLGRRVKRGLFVSKDGIILNADCQGSGNIIRKVKPNAFAEGIQGVVASPVKIINPIKVFTKEFYQIS